MYERRMTIQLSLIEAHERTIDDLFSNTYAFEIPPYQRPYAWEKDQARELLSDLLSAMENTDASSGIYFLGSIVLVKSPGVPESRVIDGQQRLTTLTILLSVLRDLTTDQDARINRRSFVLEKADRDRGTIDRYRLLLREQDRAFFRKYIQESDATNKLPDPKELKGSEQRIAENARYFRKQLLAMNEDYRNQLVAFIIQRCYLVVVAVPTPDAARRIFTVLNARGMDLIPTDIFKANLLELAGELREADLAKRWEAVEEVLGRDKFVELFGHIRMIYERDKPRSALEIGFPKVVTPFNRDADRFVSDILEPISDAHALLDNPSVIREQFGDKAAKAVRSLQRIDNKDWMPPALLRLWKRMPGDHAAIGSFLIDLERLAYFLLVTRADVNARIARFAGVMDEFAPPEPRPDKPIPSQGLSLSNVEQGSFILALSGPLYLMSRVCKPVLQRLDEDLSAGGATYDDRLLSIEHVLPQTVEEGSEWASLFPDEIQRAEWTHRIANLVLLTRRINTRASNWKFERKKREYFASRDGGAPFLLTQEVLQTDRWTVKHLEQRQDKLIATLKTVWRLTPL